jgi:hypothetical protein
VSTATARKQMLDEVAERLLAQRAEEEAATAAEVTAAKAADEQARGAFHTYLEAREEYTRLQAELITSLPKFATFMQRVAEARVRQEETLSIAQKLCPADSLPAKTMRLDIQAARERSTQLQDWQTPLDSAAASDALAALARIKRMHV